MARRERLHVPVEPVGERDWERAERRLEVARAAERAAMPVADLRVGARRLALAVTLVAGVAAGMAIMAWRRTGPERVPAPVASAPAAGRPTHVLTPPGGGSRVALADAVVDVGGDAELSVVTAADGAVTVQLVRGRVECEVEPRPGRAPFLVVAAEVTVTVVGTHFSVERNAAGGVRVGVTRGKVRVAAAGGAAVQVAAGQEWDAGRGVVATVAKSEPTEPEPAVARPRTEPSRQPEPDPAVAEVAALAASPDPEVAEDAAYRLARLLLERNRWDETIAATRDYADRFPHGARLGDVLWLRVEASCGAYRSRAADAAARAYLARFPDGPHAAAARSRAVCR